MPSRQRCADCVEGCGGQWRVAASAILDDELYRLRGRAVGPGLAEAARVLALEAEAHGLLARGGEARPADYPVLARQSRTSGGQPVEDLAQQAILDAQLWRARVVALEQAGERARLAVESAGKACEAARVIEGLRAAAKAWQEPVPPGHGHA